MSLSKAPRYLLDVNVLFALLSKDHAHHSVVTTWFNGPGLQWALCAFAEAGFLRSATAPRPGQVSMGEATAVLSRLMQQPGFLYVSITAAWQELCAPFFSRLYGTKQVTDAYLLGLAVRENLVLVTMDKAILHLAGKEHERRVLLLQA